MTPQHQPLSDNHERIREGLRGLLAHLTAANHGNLVAALAIAGDLTEVVKGLEAERDGVRGSRLAAPLEEARMCVQRAAESLSYVFSVRPVLACVAGIVRLLEDIELEMPAAPAAPLAAS